MALAHCLFNIPLAIWILEGFMSSVPKEIDETAYIDGYSFPRFFIKIFIPMIRSGIGVTLFFLFMFVGRAAAGTHADRHRRSTDRHDHDADLHRIGH
ncbi:hypothetical protein HAALTHF_40290n [Vreelandella aquamarina]|nr:hypothetical protein HAALTHF_40290n [Halomonas axialensis]